jgi:hypothetical protein
LAVSSRPLPVSSSGVLVVLIKYFDTISQERHELFMSIFSSWWQTKNVFAIHFANYIDLQISLQSSWLFLTSKKLFSMKSGQLFQCGNTIQNGDSQIQPWVDYINTTLWRMLACVTALFNEQKCGETTKTLTAIPIFKKMWYPIGIQVK